MHYAIFQLMRYNMHLNVERVFTNIHKEKKIIV